MTAPASQIRLLSIDDGGWEQLSRNIATSHTIRGFVAVYDSLAFQACLGRIRGAVGSQDVETWAYEWALRMRNPSPADRVLNRDRKIALALIYALCDQWKDPLNEEVTENTIKTHFKVRRLVNILQFVLPMDRAQALYAMRYTGAIDFGMHWVSKQDVSLSKALGKSLKLYGGFPTMNSRLVRLMDSEVLGLSDIAVFRRWMEPTLRGEGSNE